VKCDVGEEIGVGELSGWWNVLSVKIAAGESSWIKYYRTNNTNHERLRLRLKKLGQKSGSNMYDEFYELICYKILL
jgi:hypothetical protein